MAKLGELFVQIGVDLDAFNKDLKKVAKGFGNFGQTLKKAGKELSQSISLPLAGFGIAALAASKKATEAFSGFADRTKDALGRFGDVLFESLHMQGFLDGLANAIDGAVGIFEGLPNWAKTTISALGLLVVAVGPAIFIIGQLSSVVKGAAETIRLLNTATTLLAKNPLVLLATALGVAVAALGFYALGTKGAEASTRGYVNSIEKAENKLLAVREAIRKLNSEFEADKLRLAEAKIELAKYLDTFGDAPGEVSFAQTKIGELRQEIADLEKKLAKFNLTQEESELKTAAAADAWETYRNKIELADKQFALTGDNQERVNSLLAAAKEHHEKLLPIYEAEDDVLRASAASVAALEQQKLKLAEADKAAQANSVAAAAAEKQRIEDLREEIRRTTEAIIEGARTVGSFISEVVVQTIVYGKTLSSVIGSVLQSVAAKAIGYIIEIFATWVGAKIAEMVTGIYAAYSTIPFVGIAIAAGVAVAAIAGARALSRKEGGRAFAEGGVVLSPVVGLVGEAGPEVVLPLDRLGEFLGGGGGGSQLVQIILDGRVIAERVVRGMPSVLRFNGVTI